MRPQPSLIRPKTPQITSLTEKITIQTRLCKTKQLNPTWYKIQTFHKIKTCLKITTLKTLITNKIKLKTNLDQEIRKFKNR